MSNFELIDDYLTNRLGAAEKVQFEKQLESDSLLRSDLELQKNILEGVRKARALELKAMLNNVPISGGFTSGVTAGKLATAVVITGIIGTTLYFYFKPEDNVQPVQPAKTDETRVETKDSSAVSIAVQPADQLADEFAKPSDSKPSASKEIVTRKEDKAATEAQPSRKIEVTDPSDELVDNTTNTSSNDQAKEPELIESKIVVETKAGTKKYNFNYQFDQGKLVLYGAFDKSLYEILEIHAEKNTIFLYYKETYYLLDEKQDTITQLTPIKDATLLKKLKAYRDK